MLPSGYSRRIPWYPAGIATAHGRDTHITERIHGCCTHYTRQPNSSPVPPSLDKGYAPVETHLALLLRASVKHPPALKGRYALSLFWQCGQKCAERPLMTIRSIED